MTRRNERVTETNGWYDASGTYVPSMNPSLGPGSPEDASQYEPGVATTAAGQNAQRMASFDPQHKWAGSPLDDNYLQKQAIQQQEREKFLEDGGAYAIRDQRQGGKIVGYVKQEASGRYVYFDPSARILGYRVNMRRRQALAR